MFISGCEGSWYVQNGVSLYRVRHVCVDSVSCISARNFLFLLLFALFTTDFLLFLLLLSLPPMHKRALSIFLLAQNSHRVKNFKPTSTLCFGWRRPQSPPEICFILKQQSSELYLRKKDSGMRKK